jgi:hypothetical protein
MQKQGSNKPHSRLLVLVDESNVGSSVRTAGRGLDWLKLPGPMGLGPKMQDVFPSLRCPPSLSYGAAGKDAVGFFKIPSRARQN